MQFYSARHKQRFNHLTRKPNRAWEIAQLVGSSLLLLVAGYIVMAVIYTIGG